jgi:hypothetical protein
MEVLRADKFSPAILRSIRRLSSKTTSSCEVEGWETPLTRSSAASCRSDNPFFKEEVNREDQKTVQAEAEPKLEAAQTNERG